MPLNKCCIVTIQLYKCREIRNTDNSPLFRYKTFINFLALVFQHKKWETQFLLCWLYYLTQQTCCASRSPQPDWPGPAQSWISTNIFFKITKFSAHCLQAWRHSHPSPISYLGFLWHLWLSYPLRAIVNCIQCVCTCTKSWIVQSPTKPNDKI